MKVTIYHIGMGKKNTVKKVRVIMAQLTEHWQRLSIVWFQFCSRWYCENFM